MTDPPRPRTTPTLHPRTIVPLLGNETIAPQITVRDFWSWGYSDLRHNTTRGLLAQFLVARAVGDARPTESGWADFDVLTPDGIRVEVKSTAHLQSWAQSALSKLSFGGLLGRSWSDETGRSADREVRADVFVFAIQTCTDPDEYDMLDIAAWDFRVLPGATIARLGARSMSYSTLVTLAPDAIGWSDLSSAIRAATLLEREG